MKKIFMFSCMLMVCVFFLSSSLFLKDRDISFNLSKLTENNKTDRIIGKYTDNKTGEEVYKVVPANKVKNYSYKQGISGETHIYFKYYDNTSTVLHEMEYVQPDYKRHLCSENANDVDKKLGIERTGLQKLSEKLKGKEDAVIVAVVDTGVDLKHDLLKDRFVKGYDFVDGDDNPSYITDEENHGTHVSGIIVRSTPDNVKIMPVRVMNEDGGYDYEIARGILYAVKNGADVINLSLGGSGYSQYMDIAINYALSKNVVVVAAAGNEAMDAKNGFPSQKKDIIVVSALNSHDDIALFSNYGNSIDVCAPGEAIYSSVPDNKYEYMDGTSMAAPFVSAASALIKLENKKRTSAEVENILKAYADDIGTPGWDKAFGEGIVNFGCYLEKDNSFQLISPVEGDSFCESISLKYYTSNQNGESLNFYIDNSLCKSKKISRNGFDRNVLDIKSVGVGDHVLTAELVDKNGFKKSESIKFSKALYNTSFEIQNVEGKLIDYPLVYLYWMKSGKSGFIEIKDKKIENGITYMNIDMAGLLKKYDKIIAIATSDVYHPNDTLTPIYIKNIVSTGRKIFIPDNIQAVRIYEEVPDGAEFDGLTINSSQAYITPFIDGQYVNMTYPIPKSFILNEPFFVEAGAHKLAIRTSFYETVMQLEGSGVNKFNLTQKEFTKIDFPGIEGADNYSAENSLTYSVKKRGVTDISCSVGFYTSETKSAYMSDGNYVFGLSRTVKGDIVNFMKYLTLDASVSPKVVFQVGGVIKNKFLIDYTNKNFKVYVYFLDSYGNIANGFWVSQGSSLSLLYSNLFLVGKSKTYQADEGMTDLPELDAHSFQFTGQKIPDGDYKLQLKFNGKIPIYDTDFSEMPVRIKNGQFCMSKRNGKPKIIKQPGVLLVEKYETMELDLSNIFQDADKDELFYKANSGYIHNDKYYLETSNPGMQQVEITAKDFNSGSVSVKFIVLVTDNNIIYLPESMKASGISLIGSSSDVAMDLLDAYVNKLTIGNLMNSYTKNITCKEFSSLIVNFYKTISKEDNIKLASNPFKDTKDENILKTYSIAL